MFISPVNALYDFPRRLVPYDHHNDNTPIDDLDLLIMHLELP